MMADRFRKFSERFQWRMFRSPLWMSLLFLFLYPFVLTLGVEYIQKGSFANIWDWIVQNPFPFLFNTAILFFLHLIVFGLIGSFYPSAAFSALLFSLLSVISFYKRKFLGEPLFPWDLLLNKEGLDIAPLVAEKSALMYFGGMSLIILFFIALWFLFPRIRFKWYIRLAGIALSAAVLWTVFYVQPAPVKQLLTKAGISNNVWQQVENYRKNGLFLAFALNIKSAIIDAPVRYNEKAVYALAEEIVPKSPDHAPSVKPNVIIVMNEAFWDPTVMDNVTFSRDPAPTLHALQKTATSGWLLSPQFGGGTANSEFEALTGHSTSFLPPGSIAYQQYVHRPMDSLASIFKEQGYRTVAIHSYDGWFWNRNRVYPLLGFDEFISKEKMENPEYKGAFIADREVSRHIIEQVEANAEPVFIYAVTMQNHGPYNDNRYKEKEVEVSGHLSPTAKKILENYTQGVVDADASLQMLVDYFNESDEPAVVVFFGDHLPILGYNYLVYHETGFVSSADSARWSLEELRKMHSVPFVIWSNMGWEKENIPLLGMSFLGPYLLDRLDMPAPLYFDHLRSVSENISGVIQGLTVESTGALHRTPPDQYKQLIGNYWLLQYDQMFGEQYLYRWNAEKATP